MFLQIASLILAGAAGVASGQHLNFDFPDVSSPQPFNIKVDQSFIDLTLRKVRDYRPTASLYSGWSLEGPHQQNLTDVAEYWSNKYDWNAVQKQLNGEFEHYATAVPGNGNYPFPIPLHFIHQRSAKSDSIPLLLLHGWPSTSLEWAKVIKPLQQHPDQSFHIVAPDLPGFGFSPAPKQPGLGPREMGRAFDALMHQLGYEKYGIVTTDLGWFVGMWMVQDVGKSIIGHMTDFFMVPAGDSDRARVASGEATSEEAAYITSSDNWFTSHWAYATTHGQKPLALSQALADSPVGFLGWYWDINYATSDGYAYSFEHLIRDALMLWIPGPYANIRAYLEVFKPELMNFPETNVPTGVSEWGWGNGPFPTIANFAFAPKDWVERVVNLVYFKRHERGGHFPAVSQPELWIEDVREFFSRFDLAASKGKDEL